MDVSIVYSLSMQKLNRLEKVAEIVHENNVWASTSTYRVFPRPSAVQEQDQVLTDIGELKKDIQNYYSHRSQGDFVPTIKFEDGQAPIAAIETIEMYFRKYPTFDVADFRNLKLYQERSNEVFDTSCARIAPYLIATYPEVRKLQQSDVLGMIILIQEHYVMHSELFPQHTIQKCIADYGVNNSDPPTAFTDSLHVQLHLAYKLNQTIAEPTIIGMLGKHVQRVQEIASVIRNTILSQISLGASLANIIK